MFVNEHTAISAPKILLVPYESRHVSTYHTWMAEPEIQKTTASEPLTLNEEYEMQRTWRIDADKLTFIACLPVPVNPTPTPITTLASVSHPATITPGIEDAEERMIGDINLFLSPCTASSPSSPGDLNDASPSHSSNLIGEIELMIAPLSARRRGFGRATVLTFLHFIWTHEPEILGEYGRAKGIDHEYARLEALVVKIGEDNRGSLRLFEELGFLKTGEGVNYFGEWELQMRRRAWEELLGRDREREAYREVRYAEMGTMSEGV